MPTNGAARRSLAFHPVVVTSHGAIAPPSTCDWLDDLFSSSAAAEHLRTGRTIQTAQRKALFYRSLFAIVARGNHRMMTHCTMTDAAPSTGDDIILPPDADEGARPEAPRD